VIRKAGCMGFSCGRNLPSSLKMTPPRLPGGEGLPTSSISDDDGTGVRLGVRIIFFSGGQEGPRWTGLRPDPIYLDVSVPPGRRKTLPVETTDTLSRTSFAGSWEVLQRIWVRRRPTEGIGWSDKVPPSAAENRSLGSSTTATRYGTAGQDGSASCCLRQNRWRTSRRGMAPSCETRRSNSGKPSTRSESGTFLGHTTQSVDRDY